MIRVRFRVWVRVRVRVRVGRAGGARDTHHELEDGLVFIIIPVELAFLGLQRCRHSHIEAQRRSTKKKKKKKKKKTQREEDGI